jgi:hypothetical protein
VIELLGGLVVFVVLAIVLIAERIFERGRRRRIPPGFPRLPR